MNYLKTIFSKNDITNTNEISLNGISTHARLIDILDGDTITCILPFLNKFFKFHIRLEGIDTCEMKSKNELLQKKAIKAKNFVLNKLTDESFEESTSRHNIQKYLKENIVIIWIECKHFDKYGRLLGNIYSLSDTCTSISEHLIENKLAYKYHGDTKLTEDQTIVLLE